MPRPESQSPARFGIKHYREKAEMKREAAAKVSSESPSAYFSGQVTSEPTYTELSSYAHLVLGFNEEVSRILARKVDIIKRDYFPSASPAQLLDVLKMVGGFLENKAKLEEVLTLRKELNPATAQIDYLRAGLNTFLNNLLEEVRKAKNPVKIEVETAA